MTTPRGLFTIPAGTPFLDALARGLLAALGDDPAALSQVRLLLPTRRACLAAADAFLRVSDGRPLLLPRLEPLGDLDPEDWHAEAFGAAGAVADLPPPVAPARRQLLLAQLILAKDRESSTPDQALKLAEALGQWLDQVQIHDRDTAALATLVPAEYAAHWGETLRFLAILTEYWPKILSQHGVMDAVERRKAVIGAQIAAWKTAPPQTPVIAAGSTGSLPPTARLMRAILDLPAGAVVLPGLDTALDQAAWDCLPEGHPQHGLSRLLQALERPRTEVQAWPDSATPDPHTARTQATRAALLRHALRPAEAPPPPAPLAGGAALTEGLTAVAAPGPEAEAQVIALAMRNFLEHSEDQTAALVTADRGLARRVAAELTRWDIAIDDSAGEPLLETAPGVYLRLVAAAVCQGLAPVPLLALLKHPLAAVNRADVLRLERAVLRGLKPAPGLAGLRAVLTERKNRDKNDTAAEALAPLLERIEAALTPLLTVAAAPEAALTDWLTAHVQAAEALAAADDEAGPDRLWADEAGEAAALALDGLLAAAADFGQVQPRDYQQVFEGLLDSQTVRPRYGKHPRLAILGPLEARLHCPQLAILGGLNEGSWPPEPERDPWMGRHMRQEFGLPLPEWRIGLAAHDFAQALAAPEVLLTRAGRVDGAPTVPARWLGRLELAARQATGALSDKDPDPLQCGSEAWLALAGALDRTAPALPEPPAARPPVAARFRDLFVTDVERWVRDPYGHYARHILRLRPLDPLDQEPDAAERGTLLHAVLHAFVKALSPGEWPANALERLLAEGEAAFAHLQDRPGVQAFWWHRFQRMAGWYLEHEAGRWPSLVSAATEHTLSGPVAMQGGEVTLRARVDRLDRIEDAGFVVIDYKTGALPGLEPEEGKLWTQTSARAWSPQLPLEGRLLLDRHPGAELEALEAWAVGGGSREKAGEARNLAGDKRDPVAEAERAWDGLQRLLQQFADPAMPYLAEPRPLLAPRYSDYRHLARIAQEGDGNG